MKETEIREEEQEQVTGGFNPNGELIREKQIADEKLAEDLAANTLEIETTKCRKLIEIKKKKTNQCVNVRL